MRAIFTQYTLCAIECSLFTEDLWESIAINRNRIYPSLDGKNTGFECPRFIFCPMPIMRKS
ncbi:hypothetical protein FHG68_13075 [Leptospira weilii]|nr:hypothetical protein FHG67_09155 [Leptospira weilii]QDK27498.1 hypothetical protein FHG68_13075 [Leptospira weilii]